MPRCTRTDACMLTSVGGQQGTGNTDCWCSCHCPAAFNTPPAPYAKCSCMATCRWRQTWRTEMWTAGWLLSGPWPRPCRRWGPPKLMLSLCRSGTQSHWQSFYSSTLCRSCWQHCRTTALTTGTAVLKASISKLHCFKVLCIALILHAILRGQLHSKTACSMLCLSLGTYKRQQLCSAIRVPASDHLQTALYAPQPSAVVHSLTMRCLAECATMCPAEGTSAAGSARQP